MTERFPTVRSAAGHRGPSPRRAHRSAPPSSLPYTSWLRVLPPPPLPSTRPHPTPASLAIPARQEQKSTACWTAFRGRPVTSTVRSTVNSFLCDQPPPSATRTWELSSPFRRPDCKTGLRHSSFLHPFLFLEIRAVLS